MNSKERHELRYQRRKAKRLEKRENDFDNFEKVFSIENLIDSYKKCIKNVRWKASTQSYIQNYLKRIFESYSELHKGHFKGKNFYNFKINERGKERTIQSIHISERIVHRCICDYSLIPNLERTFIYDNYACLKYKGISMAESRLKYFLRKQYKLSGNDFYILLFDFSKYFTSIKHEILLEKLKKYYKDKRIIMFLDNFLKKNGDKGLGLGSQISQISALFYVSSLDHFIKEKMKIKFYGRYMDDGFLIHPSKEYLQFCLL